MFGMFGYKNPADSAKKYYGKVGDTIKPFYDPFINTGLDALVPLQEQLKRMISNPTSITNEIGSQYQASPGYQYNVDQATKAAMHAAAASGQAGSPAMQQALAGQISGLASDDFYKFLTENLGLYEGGVNGLSGLTNMGYQASNELAQSLAAALMNQGNLAYAGAANNNSMLSGLFGGIGSIIGGLF